MLTDGDPFKELRDRQEVREQSFVSALPVLGSLIVWFRTQWNNVATRWYVLPLIRQQNEFNRQLVSTLETTLQDLHEQLTVLEQNMANLDTDQVTLARDLAETRYQLIRTRREVDTLHPPVSAASDAPTTE